MAITGAGPRLRPRDSASEVARCWVNLGLDYTKAGSRRTRREAWPAVARLRVELLVRDQAMHASAARRSLQRLKQRRIRRRRGRFPSLNFGLEWAERYLVGRCS